MLVNFALYLLSLVLYAYVAYSMDSVLVCLADVLCLCAGVFVVCRICQDTLRDEDGAHGCMYRGKLFTACRMFYLTGFSNEALSVMEHSGINHYRKRWSERNSTIGFMDEYMRSLVQVEDFPAYAKILMLVVCTLLVVIEMYLLLQHMRSAKGDGLFVRIVVAVLAVVFAAMFLVVLRAVLDYVSYLAGYATKTVYFTSHDAVNDIVGRFVNWLFPPLKI